MDPSSSIITYKNRNKRYYGSVLCFGGLRLPTKSLEELHSEDAPEGSIAYDTSSKSVMVYRGSDLGWTEIGNNLSAFNDALANTGDQWDDSDGLEARSRATEGSYEYMLAECLSGPGEEADASVVSEESLARALTLPLPTLSDPLNPSLSFRAALIQHLYAAAKGNTAYDFAELNKISYFSIPYDPKNKQAALWVSKTDPTVGFLAFRGTLGAFEWGLDVIYWQTTFDFVTPTSDGKKPAVHQGFYTAYTALRKAIRSAVSQRNLTRLYVSGHSMGGALATLMAADLSGITKNGTKAVSDSIHLVTFGCPRFSDLVWGREYESRRTGSIVSHFNYRAENDVMHTLPMASMIDPFNPFGETLKYGHVGNYVYFRTDKTGIDESHSMDNYREYTDNIV